MRILVTGGAGYIGSVVAERLAQRSHDVLVFDDLSKGHEDAIVEPVRLIRGDIRDVRNLTEVLRREHVEAVVHMAACSLVGESVQHPAKYYDTNMVGGFAVLEAMRAAGVMRMVFSSSAAVYGEPERQPIDEDVPTRPSNPYGATKLAFEHALRWYADAYGVRSVSLRYFNAAGASTRCGERHDPETHLIPLVLQVAAGFRPEVVVHGDDYATRDGTCVRDYVHVLDLAEAHVLALERLNSGLRHATYNLGCGQQGYSVLEVLHGAEHVTGRRIPWRVGARRTGDPALLIASSNRITRELGYAPIYQDLEVIIESAWRFMREAGR